MIECKLREFAEFYFVLPKRSYKKTKKGFYSHTVLPIKGLGRDKWPIIVHIEIDHEKYLSEGLLKENIFHQCVEYLNQSPPRKKYAKKDPKPLYGHLTPYKARFKEDEGGKYIEAELTTDQRKNKNFWREGIRYGKVKIPPGRSPG